MHRGKGALSYVMFKRTPVIVQWPEREKQEKNRGKKPVFSRPDTTRVVGTPSDKQVVSHQY